MPEGGTISARAFKKLQKENHKGGKQSFKSNSGVTGKTLGRVNAIGLIDEQLTKHRRWKILKALGFSEITYYHWRNYQSSQRDRQDISLKKSNF